MTNTTKYVLRAIKPWIVRAGDFRSKHFSPDEIAGIVKHARDTWFKPGGFTHFIYEGDHFHANINKAFQL